MYLLIVEQFSWQCTNLIKEHYCFLLTEVKVFGTSTITGDGLQEMLEWVSEQLTYQQTTNAIIQPLKNALPTSFMNFSVTDVMKTAVGYMKGMFSSSPWIPLLSQSSYCWLWVFELLRHRTSIWKFKPICGHSNQNFSKDILAWVVFFYLYSDYKHTEIKGHWYKLHPDCKHLKINDTSSTRL